MTVLTEAEKLVEGDRKESYGHPVDSFARISALWSLILNDDLKEGSIITEHTVALMMIVLKLSREAHKPDRDNLIDICGYARIIEMLMEQSGAWEQSKTMIAGKIIQVPKEAYGKEIKYHDLKNSELRKFYYINDAGTEVHFHEEPL